MMNGLPLAKSGGHDLLIGCRAEFVYRGPDGRIVWTTTADNSVTIGGRHWLMFRTFRGQNTPPCTRVGLISDAGYTGTSVNDTYDNHPGWVEFTGYTNNGFRPNSSYLPASSGQIQTAAPVSFNFNVNGSLRGAFLCNAAAHSETGSNLILYNTIPLSSSFPVSQNGSLAVSLVIRVRDINDA